MIKKTAAALAAVCLMAGLCGCAGGSGGSGMKSIDLKESNFKELGRTYYSDGKIYCALSGTGVEFRFTGKSCSVTVEGDGNSSDAAQADNHARIAIYVNGERKIDDMVDNATEVYDVFKSDADEDVTVRVIKLSESPMSTVAISDISVDGSGVGPTEDSERLIEFVGDSITCGYGIDDEDRNHHFSTKTEDVTKTYAFKTAEALGADWSMVSFSGYGVISGYSDGTKKVSEQTVPQYYEKLGYSWSPNGSFVPANIDWGFGRLPDAVVINLGTNDDSYCKGDPTKSAEYRDEYVNLLKTVREHNPDAQIFCTLGIMGAQSLYPYIEEAVAAYSAETGDTKVTCMQFDGQLESDGIAADWHPTEATHAKAAEKLEEKIRETMGW